MILKQPTKRIEIDLDEKLDGKKVDDLVNRITKECPDKETSIKISKQNNNIELTTEDIEKLQTIYKKCVCFLKKKK